MDGRKVRLYPAGNGKPVERRLFFTFGYRGKNFAALWDGGEDFSFVEAVAVGDGVFREVEGKNFNEKLVGQVMKTLFKATQEQPSSYPVNGCHYDVQEIRQNGTTVFSTVKKRPLDARFSRNSHLDASPLTRAISILTRTALSALAVIIFMAIFRDGWVRFFLPSFMHNKPLLSIILAEVIFGTALSAIFPAVRKIGNFAITAFAVLFAFSGLGAAIVNGAVLRCTMTLLIIILALWLFYRLYLRGLSEDDGEKKIRELITAGAVVAAVTFTVVSNAAAFMLGVGAPLPKITEKEESEIESSYNSALGTIYPVQWEMSNEKSQLAVLQSIVDYVCGVELGCYVPEVVAVSDGADGSEAVKITDGEIAEYSEGAKRIAVDTSAFKKKGIEAVLKALLSECRLAWQYYIDGMYDSVSDTLDKAYANLELFRIAAEVDKDFSDGSIVGGYADTERHTWAEEKYRDTFEKYVLYRNGIVTDPVPETGASQTNPQTPADGTAAPGASQNPAAPQQEGADNVQTAA